MDYILHGVQVKGLRLKTEAKESIIYKVQKRSRKEIERQVEGRSIISEQSIHINCY